MSPTSTTICSVLEQGPHTIAQLREITGKGYEYIRQSLQALAEEGKVRKGEKTRAGRMGPPTYFWERVP